MSRKAKLEDLIPEEVQAQKQLVINTLESHKQHIDSIITAVRLAQTKEEIIDYMKVAAKKMI